MLAGMFKIPNGQDQKMLVSEMKVSVELVMVTINCDFNIKLCFHLRVELQQYINSNDKKSVMIMMLML